VIRWSWKLNIGLILSGTSFLLGILHYELFADAKTLAFYLALDIVFVPVQVLLVTLIIERLLNEREKQAMMRKLNMVIGAFFSEVGNSLIRQISSVCEDSLELAGQLNIQGSWKANEFRAARRFADGYECRLSAAAEQWIAIRDFLLEKRLFVLALLQNPNLLEHDRFTDLLWAVCHLTEELEVRPGFDTLPPSDLLHLRGDMQRAYSLLTREWLRYIEHLKGSYPYIYSLAIRLNPFKREASPVIMG
jgi:hypothetical protein